MYLLGHRSRISSSLQVRNYYMSVEEQSCTPRVKRSIAVMTRFPQQENSAVSKHWIGPYMSTQNRKHSSHHKFSSLMSINIYISLHHMHTKSKSSDFLSMTLQLIRPIFPADLLVGPCTLVGGGFLPPSMWEASVALYPFPSFMARRSEVRVVANGATGELDPFFEPPGKRFQR